MLAGCKLAIELLQEADLSPPSEHAPKQCQIPSWELTEKDGVSSSWKGQHAHQRFPLRFRSGTRSRTTSSTGARSLMASRARWNSGSEGKGKVVRGGQVRGGAPHGRAREPPTERIRGAPRSRGTKRIPVVIADPWVRTCWLPGAAEQRRLSRSGLSPRVVLCPAARAWDSRYGASTAMTLARSGKLVSRGLLAGWIARGCGCDGEK